MQIAFSRSIAFPRVPELIPTLPQVADSLRVTLTILRLRNYLCNGELLLKKSVETGCGGPVVVLTLSSFSFLRFCIRWKPLPVAAGRRGTAPAVLDSAPLLLGKTVRAQT